MKIIVAVDNNWGIGCNNELLLSIPEDKAFFRETTMGKVVVMGHNTLKSLPNSLPLKGRINIVLSKNVNLQIDNVIVCSSVEKLGGILSIYPTDDVFIIGGESIYAQLLDYCDEAYITKFCSSFTADCFFPNIDNDPNWVLTKVSDLKKHENQVYYFCKYTNKNPQNI